MDSEPPDVLHSNYYSLNMVQNQPAMLGSFVPLPAVGLGDFVEGAALHTSR